MKIKFWAYKGEDFQNTTNAQSRMENTATFHFIKTKISNKMQRSLGRYLYYIALARNKHQEYLVIYKSIKKETT